MIRLRTILLAALLPCIPFRVCGQLGGGSTYSFLNLTSSARVASLGGKTTGAWDDDLNLPFHNPALLNDAMSGRLVLNYVNYFSDVNYGYLSYAGSLNKAGTVAAGIHYINYGSFIAADESGRKTGEFRASEYALNLIWSTGIDSFFRIGVNVKPVYSMLESYRSFGIVADAGITYTGKEQLFTAALVLRNFGGQIVAYHEHGREPVPFDVLLGMSHKLQHAPFRFFIVAHDLQKPDLSYETPSGTGNEVYIYSGAPLPENRIERFGDNLMRHMIFGIEFIPLEHFTLRGGYNYQRRKELKISTTPAMVGFSWGFGIRISRFDLSYGRASYHLAGASNHFSVSMDISAF